MDRVRAYIGLGANVGDAPRTLAAAVHALAALPGTSLVGVSRLYVTAPVEVVDQPDFHNAVAALDVPGEAAVEPPGARLPDAPRSHGSREQAALALLVALKSLERAFGRKKRFRYGPRELDLDLLVFGDRAICVERPVAGLSLDRNGAASLLEVPHPCATERLFVLAPLADLAPDLVPPGWPETVASARDRQALVEGEAAVRAIADWDPVRGEWALAAH